MVTIHARRRNGALVYRLMSGGSWVSPELTDQLLAVRLDTLPAGDWTEIEAEDLDGAWPDENPAPTVRRGPADVAAIREQLAAGGDTVVIDAATAQALLEELDLHRGHEHAIAWNTTCMNCAAVLDAAYTETVRAEIAEDGLHAALATVKALSQPRLRSAA